MTILPHRYDGPSPPRKLRSVRPWADCRDALELALGTGPRWLPNCRSGPDGLASRRSGRGMSLPWPNGTLDRRSRTLSGMERPARTLRVLSRDPIEFLYPTGLLGLDLHTFEDGAGWTAFLRGLVARGLSGVRLVISDAHPGLVDAIERTRCVHDVRQLQRGHPDQGVFRRPCPDRLHSTTMTQTLLAYRGSGQQCAASS